MTRRRRDDVSRCQNINRPMLAGFRSATTDAGRGAIVGVHPLAALHEGGVTQLRSYLGFRLWAVHVHHDQARRLYKYADVRLRPLRPPATHVSFRRTEVLIPVADERCLSNCLLVVSPPTAAPAFGGRPTQWDRKPTTLSVSECGLQL